MKEYTTSDRLKQIMEERQLKQVDILRMVQPLCVKYNEKINKSHLSHYVAGTYEPNQRKLYILAQALGVSEAWLMGFDVPMKMSKPTAESGRLSAKVSVDAELQEMIKEYIELPNSEKEYVRQTIHLFYTSHLND